MAYNGKQITNPFNGQSIEFVTTSKESGGKLLEMISSWKPHSQKPVAHYHPYQKEVFEILEGSLTVMLDCKTFQLKTGERLQIPPRKAHAMWNDSDGKVVAKWTVEPAGKTEYFLESAMGLASDKKVHKNGMPDILQIALFARRYRDEFRLAKPSYFLQTIVFCLVTPIAKLVGKKAVYSRYIDC